VITSELWILVFRGSKDLCPLKIAHRSTDRVQESSSKEDCTRSKNLRPRKGQRIFIQGRLRTIQGFSSKENRAKVKGPEIQGSSDERVRDGRDVEQRHEGRRRGALDALSRLPRAHLFPCARSRALRHRKNAEGCREGSRQATADLRSAARPRRSCFVYLATGTGSARRSFRPRTGPSRDVIAARHLSPRPLGLLRFADPFLFHVKVHGKDGRTDGCGGGGEPIAR